MFEDLANQYNNGFHTPSSHGSQSIFDTRNYDSSSNNFSGSVFGELNKREANYGSLSIIDKMRGLTGGRLDMSGDIGLTEQYADKSLDKRTFNGVYNVSLVDIYKDRKLFKAHFNLHTDGMVEEEEHSYLEGDMGKEAGNRSKNDRGFVGLIKESLTEKEENIFKESKDSFTGSEKTLRVHKSEEKKEEKKKKRLEIEDLSDAPISSDNMQAKFENVMNLKDLKIRYGENILTKEEEEVILSSGKDFSILSLTVKELRKKVSDIENELKELNGIEYDLLLKELNLYKKVLMKKILE